MPVLLLLFVTLMAGCSQVMPKTSNTMINLTITDLEEVRDTCKGGPSYVAGCAIWYDNSPNVCHVYTVQDTCTITNTIRHCTDSKWAEKSNPTDCGWD